MDESQVARIRERIQHVREQIAEAAIRSGRQPSQVRLVVVTKSQPLEIVRVAVEAGATILGENYAEEAVDKIAALKEKSEVEWHMIGHVQSRKAELVAGNFDMLHSLDSVKLAGRLDRKCIELQTTLPVLLEFNVGGETSKNGFPARDEARWSDLLPEFEQIVQLPGLQVRGLMTMPPLLTDAGLSRPYFQSLRRLQEFLMNRLPQVGWQELSMGTSADFMTAVQEGATYVRVGQAVLGPRPA